MADDDMPDFDMMAPPPGQQQAAVLGGGGGGGGRAAPPAGRAVSAGDDGDLDEEDELELALEAEFDAAAEEQQSRQAHAQRHGQDEQQQQQGGVQPPEGLVLQDAARAATAATAALQQEEDDALPLTEDGFIDLDKLTAKQHQRYNTLVNEILSEQQLDRYSAFRRSNLRRGMQLLMTKSLGGAPNSKALIALSSVSKSFVDDLVATAIAVAQERGETTPLQPTHIHAAYQRLIEQEKVPGKSARRRAFL